MKRLTNVLGAVEFVTKDADATMSTMVAQPYVNHIPTMTGGSTLCFLLSYPQSWPYFES